MLHANLQPNPLTLLYSRDKNRDSGCLVYYWGIAPLHLTPINIYIVHKNHVRQRKTDGKGLYYSKIYRTLLKY